MVSRDAAEDSVEGNAFRRLLNSEFAAGMFSVIANETIVDIVGYAGFDFLVLDTEVGNYDVATIERLARAAKAAGVASVVRISPPDPHLIDKVLNTGVDGLMFPHISTRQEAEAVIRSSRPPPLGTRWPFPGQRAGQYFLMPGDEVRRRASDIAIVVLIENKAGLDNVEEILSVDGLDGVAVGPLDLSLALGVARDAPEVMAVIARVSALAKAKGKSVMAAAKDFDELEAHLRQENGPRVFWYANDTYNISTHFRALIEKSREMVAKHVGATR